MVRRDDIGGPRVVGSRQARLALLSVCILVTITPGCGGSLQTDGGGAGASGGSGGTGGTTGQGGVSGQGAVSGQGGDQSCGSVDRPAAKLPPDILIVQDASGSMNEDSMNSSCSSGCGAASKWALMTPAINQVVSQTEADVNWGLKFFADTDGTCGVAPNTVSVGIAPANSGAIAAALAGRTDAAGNVTNGSSTPTRAAEQAAVSYLTGLTDTNPKFILLATDGQPNCRASGDRAADDTAGAVAAVSAARSAGIPTFVVGISAGGVSEASLNMMAVEGGYPQVGQATQYYPASSTAEFVAVLRNLVGMANTCTFSLPPPPTSDGTTRRGDIGVKLVGGGTTTEIPSDATNGWTYTDAAMTSILLHGTACSQVRAGTVTTVTIVFYCHLP